MKFRAALVIVILSVLLKTSCGLSENSEPSTYALLSEGSQVKLGKGDNPNYLSIAECNKSQEKEELNCTIRINTADKSKDRCNVIITANPDKVNIQLDYLYRFPSKKLLVVSREEDVKVATDYTFHYLRKIRIINFNDCTIISEMIFPSNLNGLYILRYLTFFEDSFNATFHRPNSSEQEHPEFTDATFDLKGQKVSSTTYSDFSMLEPGKKTITKKIRNSVALSTPFSIHEKIDLFGGINEKAGFFCDRESLRKTYRCFYINHDGAIDRLRMDQGENVRIFNVHALRNNTESLLVVFGLADDTTLFVNLLPSGQSTVRYYKTKWPIDVNASIIIGIDEQTGTFTLAAKTKELQPRIIKQTFDLSNGNH